MPDSAWFLATALHVGAAAAGVVVVRIRPAPSTAVHSDVLGHATPVSVAKPSMRAAFQPPSGGAADVKACPASSTARHSVGAAQETARRSWPGSAVTGVQVAAPPAG